MQTIYTLKVYPNGLGKSVYRILKISGSETLDEPCCIMILEMTGCLRSLSRISQRTRERRSRIL